MEWFVPLLKKFIEKAGSETRAAKELGVDQKTINNLKLGITKRPRLDLAEELLKRMDGDISRALPDYEPDYEKQPVTLLGRVSAGYATLAVEDPQRIPDFKNIWERSRYRCITTGEVVMLEVQGDSMEPQFPDGCLLAIARPSGEIPNRTPVIALVKGEEATFKIWSLQKNAYGQEQVMLYPLNPTHEVQQYRRGDVIPLYIVLGEINPWKHGVVSNGPPPPTHKPANALLLRESNPKP